MYFCKDNKNIYKKKQDEVDNPLIFIVFIKRFNPYNA